MSRARAGVLVSLLTLASCATNAPPRTSVTPSALDPVASLVPLPSFVQRTSGVFEITQATVIYVKGDAQYELSARFLSDFIGLAVGNEKLTIEKTEGTPPAGSILLTSGKVGREDSYELQVSPSGIAITGANASGVFHGVQTLRQLLPPALEYEALRARRRDPLPIHVPAILVRDTPRFSWRGAMLDVARHFLSVEDVKRYIDLMALHKLNRLHLHLADDQGWRIAIASWPNLTTHGGSTEVGGGPGGFYTHQQYTEIVKYAADRFITIIPEIDMPGHTNAALASYAELNCDGQARPLYTGIEVGFSALCVENEITYRFIDDVVREIASLTPGAWFHIGGDEVKTLTADQYTAFINRVQGIVRSHGKHMIGWDEIAPANLLPTSIVQHWRPKTTPKEAVARGAKVIMSIADRAYLDMKYDAATPIGLNWAALIDVKNSYDWDPASVADGLSESALLGVEAPLWSETLATINDFEFLAFPRLAAIAEVGWTAQTARQWEDFSIRLGAQAPRWTTLGINFYRSPQIPWQVTVRDERR
jgi:hexosaminidase